MTPRLLPMLVISASALLALKLLGFVMGTGMIGGAIPGAVAQETAAGTAPDAAGEQMPPPAPGEQAAPDAQATIPGGSPDQTPPGLDGSMEIGGSAAERAVLESLGKRRRTLDDHEGQLDLREKLLQATEERVQKRVDELKDLEKRIESAVEEKKKQEEGEIAGLVTMYENMKPKDAARIFDRLNLTVLLKVVRQMKPRKMADILAKMSPEAAERLTVAIASDAGAVPASAVSDVPDALPKIGAN
ncbi:MotE family protein [Roseibium suaedae]|uniref:Flagellar motility protein MotE, a chaperone for MotC folding n=1 Tax=Roseibium suaedae TaxID=735517 RepID=A0A1M7GGR1_9HYPH|nr:hypothetical protein [Roseibium suaedae]SHM15318.1 Flagellar motility protein MotE, a chaperone for MotC folding [Roseibium suaedae]